MNALTPLALLLAALVSAPALATTHAGAPPAKAPKPAAKQGAKKEPKQDNKAAAADSADTEGMEPVAYDCDLGDKLTIYKKPDDDQQIALHWNRRMHRMMRKETSTGAERFEHTDSGLVWIGIPAKGMLLDSKKGRQLANECRNDDQKKLVNK